MTGELVSVYASVAAVSLVSLVGVVTLVVVLAGNVSGLTRVLVPATAGNFVYIAGSDLLPELVDETDATRSAFQLLAVLGGIGLMYALAA